MTVEDLIVSTISDAKPMMVLGLCSIVLFTVVATLVWMWWSDARTRSAGSETSRQTMERSGNMEQAIGDAGGLDLNEWEREHAPAPEPDRRPAFFKSIWGRGLVFALTRAVPVCIPLAWICLINSPSNPSPLDPAGPTFRFLTGLFVVAVSILFFGGALRDWLRRLGWVADRPRPIGDARTAIEDHYGVTRLSVSGDNGIPVVSGLYPCVFMAGESACSGVLRVDGRHVWLYGPDGSEHAPAAAGR